MHAAALSSGRAGAPTRRLRILCAEDNPLVGDILVCLLTRLGHDVRHARDGREAWNLLSRDLNAFDVVVTDHEMPELDGADLVGLLRQARFAGRIIVYSSPLNERDRARYEILGVNQIVEKSAVPARLLAAVESA
jgi:two-component system chemotaxis response regulator CheY